VAGTTIPERGAFHVPVTVSTRVPQLNGNPHGLVSEMKQGMAIALL
jgi:hypothetical protein